MLGDTSGCWEQAMVNCKEGPWWCLMVWGWTFLNHSFINPGLLLQKYLEPDWELTGRWVELPVSIGRLSVKISTGTGCLEGREGGGWDPLLGVLSGLTTPLNNFFRGGFAFSAVCFSLMGVWSLVAGGFGGLAGGSGRGHLILEPSTSRLTPTYCGTSTTA